MFTPDPIGRFRIGSTLLALIAATLATATCLTAAVGPAYAASGTHLQQAAVPAAFA